MHSDDVRPMAGEGASRCPLSRLGAESIASRRPLSRFGADHPESGIDRPESGTDRPASTRPLSRLMVAALASGSGKTLVTCALLRILQRAGLEPAAFKCGPDYIDSQFHRMVLGRAGGNLDGFFSSDDELKALLARGAQGCGCAVIEGVMGFYDGLSLDSDKASSYAVARATGTPVVLVIDARGAALTIAAVVRGAQSFRPGAGIAGIILNRCSASLCSRLAPIIERECGIPILGCLPADERFAMPSRHLGLVGAEELAGFGDMVDAAADALAGTLDLERLMEIMGLASLLAASPSIGSGIDVVAETGEDAAPDPSAPVIAVAGDAAFSFYYEENLRMLDDLGARLVFFSPLADEALPAEATGLYLGGGYPELHARELAANAPMRAAIARAVRSGMPTVAECGGFLYLQEMLEDAGGHAWPMVGALPGESSNAGKLGRFGYIEVAVEHDCLYGPAGTTVRGHEFHYWRSSHTGEDFLATKPSGASWRTGVATPTLIAGFPHAYWPSNPDCAARFVRAAVVFGGYASTPLHLERHLHD